MKTVTYGADIPTEVLGGIPRITRGDFVIEKVLKGRFNEKTISIYTGSGFGDCGRLSEFLTAAYNYDNKESGIFEIGLTKTKYKGNIFYASFICDYLKFPAPQSR